MGNPTRGDPARTPDRAEADQCSSGHANPSGCANCGRAIVWRTGLNGSSYRPPELSSALLRKSVVPAHDSRGGMVYMKLVSADAYHVSLPVAGRSFEFDFQLRKDDTEETISSAPR